MCRWEASCINHIAMILMETPLVLPACLLQADDQHQTDKIQNLFTFDSVLVVIEGIVSTECPVVVGTGQLSLQLVCSSVSVSSSYISSRRGWTENEPMWTKISTLGLFHSINHACNFYLHLYMMCLRCPWQPHDQRSNDCATTSQLKSHGLLTESITRSPSQTTNGWGSFPLVKLNFCKSATWAVRDTFTKKWSRSSGKCFWKMSLLFLARRRVGLKRRT